MKLLKSIVYGFFLGTTLMFTITFFMAFFNDYQVLVTINTFGEAVVESIMLVILWICSIVYAVMVHNEH